MSALSRSIACASSSNIFAKAVVDVSACISWSLSNLLASFMALEKLMGSPFGFKLWDLNSKPLGLSTPPRKQRQAQGVA